MSRELEENLEGHVRALAEDIGPRSHLDTEALAKSADYVERTLRSYGCRVERQEFEEAGRVYQNVIGEIPGRTSEIVVLGAHYDTAEGSPGADDNASGVAGMLEIARMTAQAPMTRTIRFAAFCLEEPPHFRSERMGSMRYAERLYHERANVAGMISLEMIGYYAALTGTQFYPFAPLRWIYPKRGDFIAFVGNLGSRDFTLQIKTLFADYSRLHVESLNTVPVVPGVDFSSHRSFWKFGWPAFMVTDTAFYRNPNYHTPEDRPDTLDYAKMADLTRGLFKAISSLPSSDIPLTAQPVAAM